VTFRCCLCEATAGGIREGRIRTGHAVPLCTAHFAASYWRSRQPQPQQITVLPAYEQHAMRAALVGAVREPTRGKA
jgi:hypothetical protein